MSDGRSDPRWALILGAIIASRRVRLFVAAALFLGWIGWLGYAAAVKSRGPVVSRAQASVATHVVVADIRTQTGGKLPRRVAVREVLVWSGPAPTDLEVANLPETQGFEGDGDYLLLLRSDPVTGGFAVVGQQRSPGYELAGVGKPLIYRWSDDVRGQVQKLFP
jgi:hypothetical protein